MTQPIAPTAFAACAVCFRTAASCLLQNSSSFLYFSDSFCSDSSVSADRAVAEPAVVVELFDGGCLVVVAVALLCLMIFPVVFGAASDCCDPATEECGEGSCLALFLFVGAADGA